MSTPEKLTEALRATLKEVEQLRQANRQLSERADEPIAIVGMDCRFPGGVRSPEQLWEVLASGRDAVTDFPVDRGWDFAALYDPLPGRAGHSFVRQGAFLDGVADFDADFFGVGAREALMMDPQHRLLLETSWTAFERAGINARKLQGSSTGVFVGIGYLYYNYGTFFYDNAEEFEGHRYLGNATNLASGRLSRTFGFEGPSITMDTGCSSSLAALHTACRALRTDECTLALVGGATVMPHAGAFVEFSRYPCDSLIAPDGRSKAFSADADGIGFSEGVAVLLLERLSTAVREHHPILAIVRGSALNQDGTKEGFEAPRGRSQRRVIQTALAASGLVADEIDAVEAHGTGTPFGDTIEGEAIAAVYGQGRPRNQPLWLGSVKSNIGHTQAAACAAGVIKMVLAMQHGVLPRTLHAEEPTPHIDWQGSGMQLLTQAQPWPNTGRPRRAGVCSYGVSGTNGHVILEQAPLPANRPRRLAARDRPTSGPPVLWVLSARTQKALRVQAHQLISRVAADPALDVRDVAFSLATCRAYFAHRAAVVTRHRDDFLKSLAALTCDHETDMVVRGTVSSGRLAFLLPSEDALGQPAAEPESERARAWFGHLERWGIRPDVLLSTAQEPGTSSRTPVLRKAAGGWATEGETATTPRTVSVSGPESHGRALREHGVTTVVSIDAHGLTTVQALDGPPDGGKNCGRPVATGGYPSADALVRVLAALHVRGFPPDWQRFFANTDAQAVSLPTYPFQRQRYWPLP
ncbi:Phenolphthiocerol synthesis polyketide synthase type I Pks15/1 (plasmid) [Streptomyces sp. YIM 121038]|uniref:type I polyketide synthase n=1 Tax=Streptomyces sp. YIM 121038 TaxID=2136401 RepID=UPI0011101081|nr:beta-ketoacyl synthase N-terminal-like domain-containing protein [Streptomyces sp. YIM 121038]QCX82583.1 Phenolphthiocerol synthesis polyketide synthase type I Pks15/1 [Streptomyces sp. YIM 121038]